MATSRLIIKFIALLSFQIFFSSCIPTRSTIPHPTVTNGILDLRGWDFTQEGITNLDGTWNFYWQQYITNTEELRDHNKTLISFPGYWVDHKEQGLELFGYGTYHLRILLKETHDPISLFLLRFDGSLEIWNNGVKVLDNDYDEGISEKKQKVFRSQVIPLDTNGRQEIDLFIPASQYSSVIAGGGTPLSLWVGSSSEIYSMERIQTTKLLFLLGSLFIIGIIHFLIYLLNRKELYSLFISLGLFGCFLVDFSFYAIPQIFPGKFLQNQLVIFFYLGTFLRGTCIPLFTYYFYPSPKVFNYLISLIILMGLAMLSNYFFVTPFIYIDIAMILLIICSQYLIFLAIINGKKYAFIIFSGGCLLAIASTFHYYLVVYSILPPSSPTFVNEGFVFGAVVYSIIIAIKLSERSTGKEVKT